MKIIETDLFEAMQKTHPIEAAIWEKWIQTGEAQLIAPGDGAR